jgi:hypothetical protein
MKTQSNRLASSAGGPYYPLGIIGTVPKAYEGMGGRKMQIKN